MRCDGVRKERVIKATIYGGRRWIVCSDTQIVLRASVCAYPFACGYQQTASHTGECKVASMYMCLCVYSSGEPVGDLTHSESTA